MIITVTMNPSIDKSAKVEHIVIEEVNRLDNIVVSAGGKGINASKMISVLGGDTIATGFIGKYSSQLLIDTLSSNYPKIVQNFIKIDNGITRVNLKIINGIGEATEFNEPGIEVTENDIDELINKCKSLAKKGDVFVIGGRLPLGVSNDTYYRLIKEIKKEGYKVVLDSSGEALSRAIEASPTVIKPNRFELMKCLNILPSEMNEQALPDYCRQIIDKGVELVALGLGAAGSLFVTKDVAIRARNLPVNVVSSVGAGDAMTGAIAFALHNGLDLEETLKLAMACAEGAVTTVGVDPPPLDLVIEFKQRILFEYVS